MCVALHTSCTSHGETTPSALLLVPRVPALVWELGGLARREFKSRNSELTGYCADGKKLSLVHSRVGLLPSSTNSVFLLIASFRKDMAE